MVALAWSSWRTVALVALVTSCGGAPHGDSETMPAPTPTPDAAPPSVVAPAGDRYGDGLEVAGTLGRMDPDAVTPVVAAAFDDLVGCWQRATAQVRWLAGDVELKVRVDRAGRVVRAHIAVSDLGSWPTERCLLTRIRELTFPRPEGGAEGEFVFPLEFPAQGRVQTLPAPRAARELAQPIGALAACAGGPDRARVTVYVGPGGAVLSAGFAADGGEAPSDGWLECAHARALAWQLEDPLGTVTKLSAAWVRP